MTPGEAGFLLLASSLGDRERPKLTLPQLRLLGRRVRQMNPPGPGEVDCRALMALGYPEREAARMARLLSETDRLSAYLRRGADRGYRCITRLSPQYPKRLREARGLDAPPVLWAWGDLRILEKPGIALVGSRDLFPENRRFACEVGRQAAGQGFPLVSGGARGADRAGQDACLGAGGQVVCVLADGLTDHGKPCDRLLFLCEDSYDLPFSAQRALSRNHVIHALGEKTFVAQSALETGGTWAGTAENLRRGFSPVFLFDDGSRGMRALEERGGTPVTFHDLEDLRKLTPGQMQCF